MEQVDRVFKLMDEFGDSLKEQFGDYKAEVEVINGTKKVVLTDGKGDRHIMVFSITEKGLNLIAVPEGEEIDPGLTQLERNLLETAGQRAVYVIGNKFSNRTGWRLVSYNAIFQRGMNSIILEWDEGEISITETEGPVDSEEDEE